MIYILEGPDGVGKTTLARAIQDKTKGHLLHASFDKEWDIEMYHLQLIDVARELNEYQDVVIDRWAPSEYVYGNVFRDGPSYDASKMIENRTQDGDVKWIYCRNDNAVQNHLKNREERKEMFNDMSKIVEEFDKYVEYTSNNWIHIPWITYDYDKVDMDQFVEELCKPSL